MAINWRFQVLHKPLQIIRWNSTLQIFTNCRGNSYFQPHRTIERYSLRNATNVIFIHSTNPVSEFVVMRYIRLSLSFISFFMFLSKLNKLQRRLLIFCVLQQAVYTFQKLLYWVYHRHAQIKFSTTIFNIRHLVPPTWKTNNATKDHILRYYLLFLRNVTTLQFRITTSPKCLLCSLCLATVRLRARQFASSLEQKDRV
jgi:hypothetical protein